MVVATYRRPESLAEKLNAPEHLARLRALPEQDLVTIPELERWSRSIPAAELDGARSLWQSWLKDPEREPALFRLSLQIGNEVDAAGRYRLFTQAAEAARDPIYRTSLAANAASTAARLGDLDGARRWLSECTVASDSLLADTTYRVAAATLAVCEGRASDAVELLGRSDGEVPMLLSYRQLAMAVRAHALDAAGDKPAAHRALDELVRERGRANATAIVNNLPADWNVDRSRLDLPWRASEAQSGWWRVAGGAFALTGAVASAIQASLQIDAGNSSNDEWFKLLGASPALLVLAGWLIWSGLRRVRIAKHGIAGDAVVIGSTRRRYNSRKYALYGLDVHAELGNVQVLATSLSSFDSKKADGYRDKTLRILWHPRHPRVAIIDPKPR